MASNITPGTQQFGAIANPTGKAGSDTQIGATLTPVEYGRTAAKSKYTTTASSGAPIGGTVSFGAAATVSISGTVSTASDGPVTAAATTSSGYSSSGATVTYTVASSVASGGTVVAGGSGYTAGEVLTVVGDTGVTFTVATIS